MDILDQLTQHNATMGPIWRWPFGIGAAVSSCAVLHVVVSGYVMEFPSLIKRFRGYTDILKGTHWKMINKVNYGMPRQESEDILSLKEILKFAIYFA